MDIKEIYNLKFIYDNFKTFKSDICRSDIYFLLENKNNPEIKGIAKSKCLHSKNINRYSDNYDLFLEPDFQEIKTNFGSKYIIIKNKVTNKTGLYDLSKEKYIIEQKYEEINFADSNYNYVILKLNNKLGLSKITIKRIESIIPIKYSRIDFNEVNTPNQFSNYSERYDKYTEKSNFQHSYIRQVTPCAFDNIKLFNEEELTGGRNWEFIVKIHNHYGIYNRNADAWIISPIYDEIVNKINGIYHTKLDNKDYYFSENKVSKIKIKSR